MAMARSRSPFDAAEEMRGMEQLGARRGGAVLQVVGDDRRREEEVLLVHSQVRRIKREDVEAREHLLRLQLLETMPAAATAALRAAAAPSSSSSSPSPRSLSPLRRAGSAIPVGDGD